MMDTLFYDKDVEPWVDHPCEVRIEGAFISITYIQENDEKIVYSGSEQAPGIYKLKGTDECSATLYGSEKSKIMYGGWSGEGYGGLWKITLGIST